MIRRALRGSLHEDDADQPLRWVGKIAWPGDPAPMNVTDAAGELRCPITHAHRIHEIPRIAIARMRDAPHGADLICHRPAYRRRRQQRKKRLIARKTDQVDGRRRVLHLTPTGQETYKAIIGSFIAREADMLACLTQSERRALMRVFDKIIENNRSWAKPY
jgi:hypothetical protein